MAKNDNNFRFKHEIAIVSKKSGIRIEQLASNMAFANAIKVLAFEENKIHTVLRAIDSSCVQDGSHEPNDIASLFIEFCDLAIKNKVSPDILLNTLKLEYADLDRVREGVKKEKINLSQIQEKLKIELEKSNITTKILQDFLNLKEDFEEVGLNFKNRKEVLNILYNISAMDKDPKKLTNEIKQIRFLNVHRVNFLSDIKKIEEVLEFFKKEEEKVKRKMNLYNPAVEVINNILQMGNSPESIQKIFEIYAKHQYLSLDQFAHDIDTYGGRLGAIYKKYFDYIRLEPDTQVLNSCDSDINQQKQLQ